MFNVWTTKLLRVDGLTVIKDAEGRARAPLERRNSSIKMTRRLAVRFDRHPCCASESGVQRREMLGCAVRVLTAMRLVIVCRIAAYVAREMALTYLTRQTNQPAGATSNGAYRLGSIRTTCKRSRLLSYIGNCSC